jgi:hypothetical protein
MDYHDINETKFLKIQIKKNNEVIFSDLF